MEFINGFNKYVAGIWHIPGSMLGNGTWELTKTWPHIQEAYTPDGQDRLLYDVIIALMEARGTKSSGKTVINWYDNTYHYHCYNDISICEDELLGTTLYLHYFRDFFLIM